MIARISKIAILFQTVKEASRLYILIDNGFWHVKIKVVITCYNQLPKK